MDDIVAELSSFIESKEGMDTIKNLASSLMSGDGDVSSMLSSLMSNGAESVISPPKKEERKISIIPTSPIITKALGDLIFSIKFVQNYVQNVYNTPLKPYITIGFRHFQRFF